MPSKDELTHAIPFVLRLWNAAGVPCRWIVNFSGTLIAESYPIYRQHNIEAIRLHAAAVFRSLLTDDESRTLIGPVRCVVISTHYPDKKQLLSHTP